VKRFLLILMIFSLALASISFALIRDNNVEWRSGRIFISAPEFAGYVAQNGVDDGAPVLAEIGSLGIVGLTMAATGDSVSTYFPVPRDIDIEERIYFRIHYTLSTNEATTGTEEATWIVTYDITAENAQFAAASTVLSTAIAADVYTATTWEAWTKTPWGYIDGLTITEAQFLAVNVEFGDAQYGLYGTFDTDFAGSLYLLGLELEYTPRRCAVLPHGFEANRE